MLLVLVPADVVHFAAQRGFGEHLIEVGHLLIVDPPHVFGVAVQRAEDLHLPAVIEPVRLPVDPSIFADAQREGGRHRGVKLPQAGFLAGIVQPDDPATRGNDQRTAVQGDVPRAQELLLARDAAFEMRTPIGPAPAIAAETEPLFDEVPRPAERTVRFQRVHARSERGEVDSLPADHGRAEDRFATEDLLDQRAGDGVDHVIAARHRAEVQVPPRKCRR